MDVNLSPETDTVRLAIRKFVVGACDVHKMVLPRNHLNAGFDFWSWG
ncbi:MAG: hypothetical protein ACI9W2_004259 [Gammaproteobacteria bacterium]|jgi:hypothetical protein